jgi:predicted XRE-type DNA-binding protein
MIDHSLETRDEFIEDLNQKIKESELKQEEPQTELLIAIREPVDQ